MSMFCYQCEQAYRGSGCFEVGVCGKDEETALLQDVLIHMVKGISRYAHHAALFGKRSASIDEFVIEALFTTVTNVDFDADHVESKIHEALAFRETAKELYEAGAVANDSVFEDFGSIVEFVPSSNRDELLEQAVEVGVEARKDDLGDTVAGLVELVLYGVKGLAAYMDHAHVLGFDKPELYDELFRIVDGLCNVAPSVDQLLQLAMDTGNLNLKVMELLDEANTGTYGHPEPTQVRVTPVKGKAILVSGHDLKDLALLLEQTKDTGINIYTHGEMLPALAYPEFKKYPHLVGNYGGAWQDQAKEFRVFPGAILMTTNCIQEPKPEYKDRLFTSGQVRWPDVQHIHNGDFTAVIEAAKAAPGFEADGPEHNITIGFGHNAVLGVADTVINAIKAGDIKRFFLIGGCDGAKPGRNYYTEMAEMVPEDCVILTLACGKFRFNKKEFGTIGGIPRLLDIGQCNDAFSAIRIASALAEAFECGVNDLPLSLIISWYEQKAVAILLSLLALGIKNINLGPSLPAFVTSDVLAVLQREFSIRTITTPDNDLKQILSA